MSNAMTATKVSHEAVVSDLYEAFARGDVAAIVAAVADDVDWRNDEVESRECPWNGNFSGKANVPGFFEALDAELDFPVFDVKAIMGSGSHVAVYLHIEITLKKNGRAVKNDSMHLWTFNDRGQIARYRHFNDTAAELAAWRS